MLGVPDGTLKGSIRRASAGLSAKPSRCLKPCGFAWVFKYCLRR